MDENWGGFVDCKGLMLHFRIWCGLASLPLTGKTPEVLQLFLKDNTFKIALVGWGKVIKAKREALNNSWDSDIFSS